METRKIKISALIAVSTVLLSVGFMQAQVDTTTMPVPDSVGIQTSPADTGRSIEIRDTELPDNQKDVEINEETNIYNTETPAPAPVMTDFETEEEKRDWWTNDDFHPGELGLRYMPTFSKFDIRNYRGDVITGEVTASNGVELIAGINFSRNIGIMAGVGYNQVLQKYRDRGLDRELNLSYLNIPVMLQLNTSKSAPVNFNLVVGPQFGINVGADAETVNGSEQVSVAVKGGDVGVAYGAGLEFGLTPDRMLRLDLGFRGMYGLVDVSDDQSGDTYTISIKGTRQTYAGYVGLAWAF